MEDKYFNKKSTANKEEKNVVIRPIIRGRKLYEGIPLNDEMNSTTAANDIAGIPKRNENLAASFLSQPVKSAVEIVTPDLETPGIIANDWEMPINKLFIYLWLFKLICLFLEISAKYINKAISKDIIAMDKFERRVVSKKVGVNNFIIPPNKTIGIVPIKIDFNNFLYKFKFKYLSESRLLKINISFLKYQKTAKTLPSWIIADNEEPGSSRPNRRDIIFKWAVLLTGINSVKPWINPYKINCKYSKNINMKVPHILIAIKKNTIYI